MSDFNRAKDVCDWTVSNLALFGSDAEKKAKLESAKTEAAWRPVLKNTEPRLFVWRIQNFQVKSWPKELHGQFFNGDSYIVLNVRKEREQLMYDVHFWIGQRSSQDEYATAAYKTVELDTVLDGKAIQHREVEGYESDLFRSYFKQITVLNGGCDSGFKHVKPESYDTRLLRFTIQAGRVRVQQVRACRKSLDSTGVFILDRGLQITQWNGNHAPKELCYRAQQYTLEMRSERNGAPKVDATLKENDAADDHPFYKALNEVIDDADCERSYNTDSTDLVAPCALLRLSDANGKLQFGQVGGGGALRRDQLTENDVFLLDCVRQLFVYVGVNASIDERRNALSYAHAYLRETDHPFASVTVVSGGLHSQRFEEAFQKAAPTAH